MTSLLKYAWLTAFIWIYHAPMFCKNYSCKFNRK